MRQSFKKFLALWLTITIDTSMDSILLAHYDNIHFENQVNNQILDDLGWLLIKITPMVEIKKTYGIEIRSSQEITIGFMHDLICLR